MDWWAVLVGMLGGSLACPFMANGHVVAAERGDSAPLLVLHVCTVMVVNITRLRPRESSTSLAQSNCCGSSIASVVAVSHGETVSNKEHI